MKPQKQYEKICQRLLRKHYRAYRKRISDPFFVDSHAEAEIALNKMLRDAREEMETSIYIDRRDLNSRRIAEIIKGTYLNIGRKYGERYYKKKLNRDDQLRRN